MRSLRSANHDADLDRLDQVTVVGRGWLHPGSIVVADNVGIPRAPNVRRYMREQPDLVLKSEYLG